MKMRTWMAVASVALIAAVGPALAAETIKPAKQAKTAKQAEAKEQDAVKRIELGAKAPMADAEMIGVDGKKTSIAKVAGKKGTLVIFTCNACPWVKAWEERTVAIGNRFAKEGFGVIAINSNDPDLNDEDGFDVMKTRAKQRGVEYPYVVDATSDVARAFGATRTPEVFLFDAKGELVYHGVIDDNAQKEDQVKERYLESALEAVSAGKKVEVQETKALGCTIKFRKEA